MSHHVGSPPPPPPPPTFKSHQLPQTEAPPPPGGRSQPSHKDLASRRPFALIAAGVGVVVLLGAVVAGLGAGTGAGGDATWVTILPRNGQYSDSPELMADFAVGFEEAHRFGGQMFEGRRGTTAEFYRGDLTADEFLDKVNQNLTTSEWRLCDQKGGSNNLHYTYGHREGHEITFDFEIEPEANSLSRNGRPTFKVWAEYEGRFWSTRGPCALQRPG